jgi:sugar phosphate isomerase/epimerase
MQAVGTDMLQVGSSILSDYRIDHSCLLQVGASDSIDISADKNGLASDLRELSDLMKPHDFRIAYENWCWATRCPTWSHVWEIVQLVNRDNVGLCLDTFQIAGSEWADPTKEDGIITHDGIEGLDQLEAKFERSLEKLSQTIPKDKIFFFQISDAYKPSTPIEDEIIDGLKPRGRWSHDFRPLPFDSGYLPVVQVTKAILNTGYRDWFSTEVFDGGKDGKGKAESEEADLKAVARYAMNAHVKLMNASAED